MKRYLAHIAAVVSIVALIGCGEAGTSRETTAGTSTTTVAPTTSTIATTTTVATTATTTTATTTTATTSSPVTSTIATNTTAGQVPGGWTDFEAMPTEVFPPCCGSNWEGTPSPPLTADPAPVADGIYNASRFAWSRDDPTTLVIELRRFEACGLLPVESCEPPEGETYPEGQLGISPDPVRRMSITLDNSVAVGVAGWDEVEYEGHVVKRQGSGADLVSLMVALDRAYEEVLAAPLLAGVDPDAIVAGLLENPARGFGPTPYSRTLRYSYEGAPPLLFQAPFDYTDSGRVPIDGTSILLLTAIQFDHGVVSLYFYAGYYP